MMWMEVVSLVVAGVSIICGLIAIRKIQELRMIERNLQSTDYAILSFLRGNGGKADITTIWEKARGSIEKLEMIEYVYPSEDNRLMFSITPTGCDALKEHELLEIEKRMIPWVQNNL